MTPADTHAALLAYVRTVRKKLMASQPADFGWIQGIIVCTQDPILSAASIEGRRQPRGLTLPPNRLARRAELARRRRAELAGWQKRRETAQPSGNSSKRERPSGLYAVGELKDRPDANPVNRPAPEPFNELTGVVYVALRLLADIEMMLDPDVVSFWKLNLKQRRRGERRVPLAIAEEIYDTYEAERTLGGTRPCFGPKRSDKTIIGELAYEYGLPDTTIRGIIRRTAKYLSAKRRSMQKV